MQCFHPLTLLFVLFSSSKILSLFTLYRKNHKESMANSLKLRSGANLCCNFKERKRCSKVKVSRGKIKLKTLSLGKKINRNDVVNKEIPDADLIEQTQPKTSSAIMFLLLLY